MPSPAMGLVFAFFLLFVVVSGFAATRRAGEPGVCLESKPVPGEGAQKIAPSRRNFLLRLQEYVFSTLIQSQ